MSRALSYVERIAGRKLKERDEEEDPRALEEAERVAGRKLKKREKREPKKTRERVRRRFREEDYEKRASVPPPTTPKGTGLVGLQVEALHEGPAPRFFEDLRLDEQPFPGEPTFAERLHGVTGEYVDPPAFLGKVEDLGVKWEEFLGGPSKFFRDIGRETLTKAEEAKLEGKDVEAGVLFSTSMLLKGTAGIWDVATMRARPELMFKSLKTAVGLIVDPKVRKEVAEYAISDPGGFTAELGGGILAASVLRDISRLIKQKTTVTDIVPQKVAQVKGGYVRGKHQIGRGRRLGKTTSVQKLRVQKVHVAELGTGFADSKIYTGGSGKWPSGIYDKKLWTTEAVRTGEGLILVPSTKTPTATYLRMTSEIEFFKLPSIVNPFAHRRVSYGVGVSRFTKPGLDLHLGAGSALGLIPTQALDVQAKTEEKLTLKTEPEMRVWQDPIQRIGDVPITVEEARTIQMAGYRQRQRQWVYPLTTSSVTTTPILVPTLEPPRPRQRKEPKREPPPRIPAVYPPPQFTPPWRPPTTKPPRIAHLKKKKWGPGFLDLATMGEVRMYPVKLPRDLLGLPKKRRRKKR